jgi:mxaD protein
MRQLRFILTGIAACTALFIAHAHAHGPTPQKVEESIEIAAPPEKVWEVAKEFAKIGDWHPLVEKSEGTGGNAAGGSRTVTLKSGGALEDSLDDYNEQERSFAYRLAKENIEAFPVSFYTAELSLKPGGAGTTATWIGRFYRADTGNFPSETQNDAAAIAAMQNFFQEGLMGLKAKVEGK